MAGFGFSVWGAGSVVGGVGGVGFVVRHGRRKRGVVEVFECGCCLLCCGDRGGVSRMAKRTFWHSE